MDFKIGSVDKAADFNNLMKSSAKGKNDPVEAFKNVLETALTEVNELDKESRHQMELLASGEAESIHDVMIAMEKSKIAMDFTVTVRNKAVEAYKEIMRMQM